MTTNISGPEDVFEPDAEDWPRSDPSDQSVEAMANDADDLSAALLGGDTMPDEADEADVLEQRLDMGIEDEDELDAE